MTAAGGRIVAVGHVGIMARDLGALARFYRGTLGLRQMLLIPGTVAIYEVGTTDLFLVPGDPIKVEFDLAADDVDALRARLAAAGVACEEARDDKVSGHRGFAFTDPEGNRVRVVNAHQPGRR